MADAYLCGVGRSLWRSGINHPSGSAHQWRVAGSMLLKPEDIAMNALDFSPLFRSTIGFDRLTQLVDASARPENTYPPYNIEVVGDNAYRLTVAVAGFGADELDITAKDDTLVVSGKAKTEET